MLALLVGIPLLSLVAILQSTVISQVSLLQGTVDLMLITLLAWGLQAPLKNVWLWTILGGLLIGSLSSLPWWIWVSGYALSVEFALLLRKIIWPRPLSAMLVATFVGSWIMQFISLLTRVLNGVSISILQAINLISLPSLLLNLLAGLILFGFISDLVNSLFPPELEV